MFFFGHVRFIWRNSRTQSSINLRVPPVSPEFILHLRDRGKTPVEFSLICRDFCYISFYDEWAAAFRTMLLDFLLLPSGLNN